jgi:hypothetical protein
MKLATSTTFGEMVIHDTASSASNEASQGTIIQEVVLD